MRRVLAVAGLRRGARRRTAGPLTRLMGSMAGLVALCCVAAFAALRIAAYTQGVR